MGVLISHLNKIWRIFGTGFSFFIFGLGGLLLAVSWLPAVYLLPVSVTKKQRLSRLGLHRVFRIYVQMMVSMRLLSTKTTGLEHLPGQGAVIAANHPCLLDVVFLIAQIPNANCIVKRGLFTNPFTWPTVKATGYICADDEALLEKACLSLEHGDSLLIFPEGTRTTPGKASKYQRGAAHMALITGKPLCPARISVSPATLLKGQPWYDVPDRAFNLDIEFIPPLDVKQNDKPRSVKARMLTRQLKGILTEAEEAKASSEVAPGYISVHNSSS